MRIAKNLRKDQDTLLRFLDVFGGGSAALGASGSHAQPGFFVFGSAFIHEYVEPVFFRKVNLLLTALENSGFAPDTGAIGAIKNEQVKCREAAEVLSKAAKDWQGGDVGARMEVGWAASEFTSTLRQILQRLKNLIFPLLEQNIAPDDEYKILEELNVIAFEVDAENNSEKFVKLIETLEDELSEWK